MSVVSRFSLLNRRVSNACTFCGECRRGAAHERHPTSEPHNTGYADCVFCLECDSACPNQGIEFGFGALAGKALAATGGRSQSANSERQTADGVAAGTRIPLEPQPLARCPLPS